MTDHRTVVVSLVGVLLSGSPFALGATEETIANGRETESNYAVAITGLVADEGGKPLKGALVSVFGKALQLGALTAVTDEEGRFEVTSVPPGLYQLRAYLDGFMPSSFAKVVVEEGARASASVLMSLAALAEETAEAVVAETDEPRSLSELKWILQHGPRNILRDEERWAPVATVADSEPALASFEPSFALSGEFGVRGSDFEQGLKEFPGAGAGLDAHLAYARLFIPTQNDGRWLVSAQLLESALSSWAGSAEYSTGGVSNHTVTAGVTYGNYVYGDLEEYRPPEAALARRPLSSSTEWFGSAYASDTFLVGSAAVSAGLSFQYFDYLERPGYWAPRLEVSQPLIGDNTVLRGAVDHLVQAPGGEDIALLSRVASEDVYGPSPNRKSLNAERTTRVQLGVEQQISERTRVTVGVFQENADDQLVKMFTPERFGGGHFRVSNNGDFTTRGIGVSLFQSLGAVQGTVGYRFGRMEALAGLPVLANAASASAASLGLVTDDDIHDVTTTIATSIDRTRTRLHAVYRVMAHPRLDAGVSGSGRDIDTRFSLQVYQLLPFVGWNGTRWELMVAVRDLFYEDLENSSLLDEMAVIDAPRRVLGGVTVRF